MDRLDPLSASLVRQLFVMDDEDSEPFDHEDDSDENRFIVSEETGSDSDHFLLARYTHLQVTGIPINFTSNN